MNRKRLSARRHCRLDFGEFCEVYDQPEHSNSMKPRTHAAIAQGSYYFFCLTTGEILKRQQWVRMPMPGSVVQRVEEKAKKEGNFNGLGFLNRNQQEFSFQNEDYDDRLVEPEEEAPYPDIPAQQLIGQKIYLYLSELWQRLRKGCMHTLRQLGPQIMVT